MNFKKKYIKQRTQTDGNYRLTKNTRSRIYHALNGKSKSPSTRESLGIDSDTYRKWIEFQGTSDKKWENFDIDHVRPFSSFDISNNDELEEAFCWKKPNPYRNKIINKWDLNLT